MTDMERTRLAEADLRIAKCKAHPSLSKNAFGRWLCTANLRYARDMLIAMEAILCALKGPRAYCFCVEYGVRCASELRCWSVLGDERAVEIRALRIWWQQRAHRSTVGCDSITTRL